MHSAFQISKFRLARRAKDGVYQSNSSLLRVLVRNIFLRALDTLQRVLLRHDPAHPANRLLNCGKLVQHIAAGAVLLNHALDTPGLALDPSQAFEDFIACLVGVSFGANA